VVNAKKFALLVVWLTEHSKGEITCGSFQAYFLKNEKSGRLNMGRPDFMKGIVCYDFIS
jgi:hypothetical protein